MPPQGSSASQTADRSITINDQHAPEAHRAHVRLACGALLVGEGPGDRLRSARQGFWRSRDDGLAPVPVPPPMPQVTKTISAPRLRRISSLTRRQHSAEGRMPPPRPLVMSEPIWSFCGLRDIQGLSVRVDGEELNASTPISIMRFTACCRRHRPTTRILALVSGASIKASRPQGLRSQPPAIAQWPGVALLS